MGKRGEGWFLLQLVLMVAIVVAPRSEAGTLPAEAINNLAILRFLGGFLFVTGGLMGLAAIFKLGRNLTPFPKPVDDGKMVRQGLYRLVRHPIYLSVILTCLGWALWRSSLIGTVLSLLLFLFFDAKTRVEERWLVQQYPEYTAYQQEVKRLIPWLY
jgi:protein-S-isoprenylcysteine O-methyltransferase Ste14